MAAHKPLRRFAERTHVEVAKSKAELDALLAKHGATQRGVFEDDITGRAVIQFTMSGRCVRLEVKTDLTGLPDPKTISHQQPKAGCPQKWNFWTVEQRNTWLREARTQRAREAWRRVLLVTRAKLEIVADGASTLEREFLADVMLPDGRTVHEALAGELAQSYLNGSMPQLLLGTGGT